MTATDWVVPEIADTERFTFMHGHRSTPPGLFDRLYSRRIYVRNPLTMGRAGIDQVADELNRLDRINQDGGVRWSYNEGRALATAMAEDVLEELTSR